MPKLGVSRSGGTPTNWSEERVSVRRLDGPLGREFIQVMRTPWRDRAQDRAERLRETFFLARVVQDNPLGDFKVFRPRELPEVWREVPGFPEYHVSSRGRVKRVHQHPTGGASVGRCLKPWEAGGRRPGQTYHHVDLSQDGKKHRKLVHRLVARAFLGSPKGGRDQVHHKNEDRLDNRVTNLEWVSHTENQRRKSGNGVTPPDPRDPIVSRDPDDDLPF